MLLKQYRTSKSADIQYNRTTVGAIYCSSVKKKLISSKLHSMANALFIFALLAVIDHAEQSSSPTAYS